MQPRPVRSQDFAQYVPYTLTKSSEHLNWRGFRVETVRDHSAGEITLPPLDHHLLNLIVAVPTRHEHRWAGVRREEIAQEGAASLVPAGHESYWRWNYLAGGTPCDLHLHLDPAFVRRVAVADLEELPSDAEFRANLCFYDDTLRALTGLLLHEVEQDGVHGSLYSESIATSIVALLLRSQKQGSHALGKVRLGAAKNRLHLVCGYIEEHLAGDLHLQHLGEIAGLGPDRFSEVFRSALGVSPYRYVLQRKVERAKHLLRGDLSITEVAGKLGFADHAHFTATFRRITGITPSRFRLESGR